HASRQRRTGAPVCISAMLLSGFTGFCCSAQPASSAHPKPSATARQLARISSLPLARAGRSLAHRAACVDWRTSVNRQSTRRATPIGHNSAFGRMADPGLSPPVNDGAPEAEPAGAAPSFRAIRTLRLLLAGTLLVALVGRAGGGFCFF